MSKPVILTGLRANNDLHIGNYFGALLPLIDMAKHRSDEFQINLFVPDLHSFTTPIDHSQLQAQILNNLKLFVAAGLPLDNPDIHIYRQSYVPAHSELTWILDCFTGFGEMRRMTQFKDKALASDEGVIKEVKSQDELLQRLKQSNLSDSDLQELASIFSALTFDKYIISSVGLFNYPVLMAADILLYGATYVPVGDDQTQHLEFTRDIAERMNNKFGQLFEIPKPVKEQHAFFGKEQGLRIKDLVDPTKKMSKSDDSGKGVIFLGDNPDAAAKKIHSATTDSFGKIDPDNQDQPGVQNLMQILALAGGHTYEEVKKHYLGEKQYGGLKIATAAAVSDMLREFQERLSEVDEAKLLAKLEADEKKMNKVANATLLRVQQAVGLRPKE